jgi:hypothetical protein
MRDSDHTSARQDSQLGVSTTLRNPIIAPVPCFFQRVGRSKSFRWVDDGLQVLLDATLVKSPSPYLFSR